MNPLKLHSLLIIGLYIISIIIRALTFDYWSTEKHWLFLTGTLLSGFVFIVAMVWLVINGIRIFKTAAMIKNEKAIWLFINASPVLFIIIMSLLYT